MSNPAALDQLLEAANTTPGLSIISDNPSRLHVELLNRVRTHRQNHPEAFRNLRFISGKSPRELYILNGDINEAPTEGASTGDSSPLMGEVPP